MYNSRWSIESLGQTPMLYEFHAYQSKLFVTLPKFFVVVSLYLHKRPNICSYCLLLIVCTVHRHSLSTQTSIRALKFNFRAPFLLSVQFLNLWFFLARLIRVCGVRVIFRWLLFSCFLFDSLLFSVRRVCVYAVYIHTHFILIALCGLLMFM